MTTPPPYCSPEAIEAIREQSQRLEKMAEEMWLNEDDHFYTHHDRLAAEAYATAAAVRFLETGEWQ